MLQIQNVPEELHRKLKARAALAGMSMSEYALRGTRLAAAPGHQAEIRLLE